jgi:hypothetical protein
MIARPAAFTKNGRGHSSHVRWMVDALACQDAIAAVSMSEREGTLRMMVSGRWAVYRPGRLPVEIIASKSPAS